MLHGGRGNPRGLVNLGGHQLGRYRETATSGSNDDATG